jgi:hypothetical protein
MPSSALASFFTALYTQHNTRRSTMEMEMETETRWIG